VRFSKIAVLVLASSGSMAGGCNCTRGSGEVELRALPLHDFDALVVGGAPDVEVTVGGGFSVIGELDANLWPHMDISTKERVLYISRDPGGYVEMAPSEIRVTMPALRSIEASEWADVSVEGLAGGELDVRVSGDAEVVLTGRLDQLRARTSTQFSSDEALLDAASVTLSSAELTMSGGDVRLGVVEDRVEARGRGDLLFGGNPPTVEVEPRIEARPIGDPADR
jgi:hypothetical protein